MKSGASVASCWALMLGCLAILLASSPAAAQIPSIPGGVTVPATTAAPTAAGEVGTPAAPAPAPAPVLDEDSDEPVVIVSSGLFVCCIDARATSGGGLTDLIDTTTTTTGHRTSW